MAAILRSLLIVTLVVAIASAQIVAFDCRNIPETCKNMCFGANCRNLGNPYTFDTRDTNVKTARRNAAGCTRNNRCKGRTDGKTTCDEFPFASTSSGGANAVTRCVSLAECRSQGGSLSSFYRGINLNTVFRVAVSNFGGVTYCNNARFCTNDGQEFQHGRPAPKEDTNTTSSAMPTYMTKGGVEVLSVSGPVAIGEMVFFATPGLSKRDDCSDGTDETRRELSEGEIDVDAKDGLELGHWDEIDYQIS